ncbi:aminoacyl-tRNA hydrolase [Nitrospirillum sp. BR 11164]|uniref:aminoacyl-tRNA hydrolase n=1 Tax=Nitrospirillum sp. BR 11164 TaxID=3104324 RepID=UPI002AFEFA39|nr:aminoacyl-tRNA hydrolase [Nitrospirillum sp. BR 11164]MEA1651574.1 aminoacyl-tRNA hydrolase [Nitrospirillum sp. BR 11164]
MRLVVGLGNPGPEYAHHRHNVGFMAVDEIAHRHRFGPWKKRFQGLITEGQIGPEKVYLLKPQTFMNLSGQSVGEAMRFYKMTPDQVIVLHDELDLPPGKLRAKKGGGHGGHNGLRSIDDHIGKDYWRVRLGIGHPGDKNLVHGWVLSNFAKADQAWLVPFLDAVVGDFSLMTEGEPEKFQSRVALVTQPPKPAPKPDKTGPAADKAPKA